MSAERRSRTVTAYRYAFTLSHSSSVAIRIGSTILSFGRTSDDDELDPSIAELREHFRQISRAGMRLHRESWRGLEPRAGPPARGRSRDRRQEFFKCRHGNTRAPRREVDGAEAPRLQRKDVRTLRSRSPFRLHAQRLSHESRSTGASLRASRRWAPSAEEPSRARPLQPPRVAQSNSPGRGS